MEKSHHKPNGAPPLPTGGVAAQAAPKSDCFWDDEDFQDQLAYLLVRDREALERCAEVGLDANNLRPLRGMKHGTARWTVGERALEHFKKHGEPLGKLARADALEYAAQIGMGSDKIRELTEYLDFLAELKPAAKASIVAKVIRFKGERLKAAALQELSELQATGQLTDEKWHEISQRAFAASGYESEKNLIDAPQWPEPLQEEAFYGLAGDIVRAIEPNTESDSAALLVQFLLAFGNVIGRHAYWKVESTLHYLNLFAVLVGATSKARKGTSLDRVLNLFEDVDRDWLAKRRMGGLSTGEGLIKEVRDPVLRQNKAGEDVGDPGEPDKRLLIVEPEFARVLKVGERDAATLPSILRDAWDRGELRTLVKESPLRATGAHISLIAHITEGELRRTLSDTNRCNGFANRFLWVCVRRSKSLPLGGAALAPEVRTELIDRLRKAKQHAATVRCMTLSKPAMLLWKKMYPELSEGLAGMLGAATDRAEAQVRRLACLYAVLDCERFVYEKHLRAALEVWRHCLDSARFLFGTSQGDPIADAILKELRRRSSAGMSRNDIRKDLFQQNKSSEAVGHALDGLRRNGLARCRAIPGTGAGRPTEQWYAI